MKNLLVNRLLVPSLALAAAASLGAQVPAAPAAPTAPVPLDAIIAVVGDQPITRFDLREALLAKIQRGEVKEPTDSASDAALQHDVLDDLIQDELLIQKAKDLKIEVLDAEITPDVDRQVRDTRARFPNESEFRNALVKASLGTPEEYRRFLMEQFRRQQIRQKVLRKLNQDGKIVPINVTDAEISAEFEKAKEFIPKKPATVTFKQIVIAPTATAAAREAARLKAEAVLAEIKGGADFEKIAKRESMDPQTRETGGDIGWARRGENVPEFDRWLFGSSFVAALQPGSNEPGRRASIGLLHHPRRSRAAGRGEGASDRDRAEDRLARRCSGAEARRQCREVVAGRRDIRHAGEEIPRLRRQRGDEHSDAVGARQPARCRIRRRSCSTSHKTSSRSRSRDRRNGPTFRNSSLRNCSRRRKPASARWTRCAPPCEASCRSAVEFAATSTRSRSRRTWRSTSRVAPADNSAKKP